MSDPDLSGIDPLRVPEARRRIATLERYLALPNPNTADAVRLGQTIGLSRWQFQRLARAWRDHRDARLIVGGKRGRSKRDYGIAPRADEIMDGVIVDADLGRRVTEIADEIERRCAEEAVAPPSRPTIWNHVRDARRQAPASGPPRVVVGRMWFHLPMLDRPAAAMPVLLAAVALPEGRIVAHRISTDPTQPPSPAAVVEDLLGRRTPGSPARDLVMSAEDRWLAAPALAAEGMPRTPAGRQNAQADLSRSLAGGLGGLHALYRRSRARPATRKASVRFEEPLAASEVAEAIERAVSAHNAALADDAFAFDLATKRHDPLGTARVPGVADAPAT